MNLSVLIVLIIQFFAVQGQIQVILKYAEFVHVDERYITNSDIYVNDNNGLNINITIIKEWPESTESYLRILGATMGEYLIDTGINVHMPFCETLNEPVILGSMHREMGFSEDNCPAKPGLYATDNYGLQNNMFPTNFPPNQYKIISEERNNGKPMLVSHTYFEIQ